MKIQDKQFIDRLQQELELTPAQWYQSPTWVRWLSVYLYWQPWKLLSLLAACVTLLIALFWPEGIVGFGSLFLSPD